MASGATQKVKSGELRKIGPDRTAQGAAERDMDAPPPGRGIENVGISSAATTRGRGQNILSAKLRKSACVCWNRQVAGKSGK